jgi:hypothetical protein
MNEPIAIATRPAARASSHGSDELELARGGL